ncbi:threonine synthase [Salsipaludibacter albus]|uniref:threonine synthase n=1 Tax=Salsipaludibacter albus TaxID=2849650 RepID=UPI001EE43D49|nr:threonine synthase [Salsipaludibacter albus]MBY5160929.1 threonine synthase [Salsipaludibacter albus]
MPTATAPPFVPAREAADLVPNLTGLACRECGEVEEVGLSHVCGFCFGPLEVVYDTDAISAVVSRERIEAGPPSLWRYGDLLPTLSSDPSHRVDLQTGLTPLRPAPRLAERLGLSELWLKDDTVNPSGSFKDRVVTVALSAGRALGIETFACASTGNLGNSVSAHAAAIGAPAYVFIPADLETGKVLGSAVHGPNLVTVRGNYDDVNRLCAEVADDTGWGFVNVNLRTYYAEGSKTIGFEIAEQLGWRFPDHVVAPIASGAMMVKIDKAFRELASYGLVDGDLPRVSGGQATGCSPVAEAFARGSFDVRPQKPDTIARSLAIGNPADGYYALKVADRTGGAIGHVPDDEIIAGIRLLAETEGVFAETAGGVTVANLKRMVEAGTIGRDERTVAVISGNGYKTVEAIADDVGPSFEVSPSLDDFLAQLS